MSKPARPILALLLTVLALSRPATAQSGDELKKFTERMVQAEQQYGHVEFRSKWIHYKRTGELQYRAQLGGFMAGPYCVTEQTTEYPARGDASPRSSIQGGNPRYRFLLDRKADTYVLTEVTAPFSAYQPWQCSFAVPFTLDTYHVLLGRPETRVVSRSEVAWRGRPHTEWVLDTTTGRSGTTARFAARIGLFVRPDRPGVVCGIRWYDAEDPAQWLEELVVEYETDGGPWPAPKAIEEWKTDKTKWLDDKSAALETWRTARTEFSLWQRLAPDPPGEQFTLSHYNLPEPKQVPTTTAHLPGVPRGASQSVPPPTTQETGPDSEEPSPLADLVEAAGAGPWPWLAIGSILVVAASIYIRFRRRAETSEA